MREVPAVLFGFMCRSMEREGADIAPALMACGLANVDRASLTQRIDWNRVAAFINRCSQGLDEEAQERLGELYVAENHYLQIGARMAMSAAQLHDLLWQISAKLYPHFHIRHRVDGPTRVRVWFDLPEPYEPSTSFFRATTGVCRSVTRVLGLGDAEVRADVGPRWGYYDLRLPEEHGLVRQAWGQVQEQAQNLGIEFVLLLEQVFSRPPSSAPPPILWLQQAYGLTRAEARVAVRLARGWSPAEIAQDLGVRIHTVRTHLQRAYDKTRTHRQVDLARLVLAHRAVNDESGREEGG